MWTPDVYQGAPSSVTAFMAAGAKIAGFAALLRVFALAFPSLAGNMAPILAVLSALTMIVGNVIAIAQTNIKRLLAYSSIAHAGYILMAFVPYGQSKVVSTSVAAGLFYLVSYMLTNFGAWAVVIALEKSEGKGLRDQRLRRLGPQVSRSRRGDDRLYVLADRHPAHAGIRWEVLFIQRRHCRTILFAGNHRRADFAHLRLLLFARGGDDVHARRRSRNCERTLAQYHVGTGRVVDGGRQPCAAVFICMGKRGGVEVVLEFRK